MSALKKALCFCGLVTMTGVQACSDGPKGQAVTIAYKFPLNSEYVYSTTALQTIRQQMAGMNSEISQHMQLQSSYRVVQAERKNRKLTVSYDHLYIKSSSNGMVLEYDSRDSTRQPAELRGISSLIDRPFSVLVNETGKVLNIEHQTARDTAVAARTGGAVSDSGIIQMVEQSLNVYTDRPVRPGDSWKKSYLTNIGFMDMQVVSDYKLISVENGTAHLEVNAVIKSIASENPNRNGMNIEMWGSQRGTLDIDVATGLIQDSRFTQDISGRMRIPGAEIPMTLTSETRIMGKMK